MDTRAIGVKSTQNRRRIKSDMFASVCVFRTFVPAPQHQVFLLLYVLYTSIYIKDANLLNSPFLEPGTIQFRSRRLRIAYILEVTS